MGRPRSLTEGNIFSSLIRFAVPVLFTLFLQALYGGVDLLVVGQFAQTADVSGVATGSMLLQTVTMVVTGLSMGITILVGERIGRREPEDAGRAIGGGICLFACFAVLLTAVLVGGAEVLARLMHAPDRRQIRLYAHERNDCQNHRPRHEASSKRRDGQYLHALRADARDGLAAHVSGGAGGLCRLHRLSACVR